MQSEKDMLSFIAIYIVIYPIVKAIVNYVLGSDKNEK